MRNHGVNLLGHEVKDPASGLVGIADMRVTTINGNVRYSVQPKSTDAKELKPAWEIDEHNLEVVGPGNSAIRISPPPNISLELGFEVEDLATGMKGILIEKHESMNGCVSFEVVSKMRKNGQSPLSGKFPHERLKKIGKGVSEKIKQAAEKADEQPVRTPARRPAATQHPGAARTLSARTRSVR